MTRRSSILLSMASLSGCAYHPLGYLDGAGPSSLPVVRLGWGLIAISLAVCVIIAVLLIWAIGRHRREPDNEGLAVRRDTGGLAFIYWGVGLSIPVLLGITVWTLSAIRAVAAPPRQPPLTLEVTGARWWWAGTYRGAGDAQAFTTANEFVIPTGVPVRLVLRTRDVIHSFWVPKLAGKMDMIPGKTNIAWLQADRPGVYRGQCTEYCGLQHAKMGFVVDAVPPEVFRRWWSLQLSGRMTRPVPLATAAVGEELFMQHCAACHAVRGTGAGGNIGPDLTGFGQRATIAAATLPNTPVNLIYWIGHTQELKPGANMPEVRLPPAELAQISAWLEAQ